jgi:hypothetical protein
MEILKSTVVTLLVLVGWPVALAVLASPAAAQNPGTTVPVGQLLVTTSTLIGVSPGSTFETGGVHTPTCPRGTRFLVTEVQAAPLIGFDVVNLPKWAVSVAVLQVASNGSSSPRLNAFANGPEQASTSIGGGQPMSSDEDSNVSVHLLGGAAAVTTTFAVHVTGYCGVPFVTP